MLDKDGAVGRIELSDEDIRSSGTRANTVHCNNRIQDLRHAYKCSREGAGALGCIFREK